jgi:hypothetical protein
MPNKQFSQPRSHLSGKPEMGDTVIRGDAVHGFHHCNTIEVPFVRPSLV